jgi:hypothetical protein
MKEVKYNHRDIIYITSYTVPVLVHGTVQQEGKQTMNLLYKNCHKL